MTTPTWRTASYSDNGGNCIEVATGHRHILIRDSKNRPGAILKIAPTAWHTFTSKLKQP